MSKRFSVTVPDTVFEQLEALAKSQGRTTANLAAYLVEVGIRNTKAPAISHSSISN
jgi:predicted DNA-binding protein